MLSLDASSQSLSARDWPTIIDPPATSPGFAPVSDLAARLYRFPLSRGGVGERAVSSHEQPGVVTGGKSVIVLHTETSYCALRCDLIGEEVGKVCFQTADACKIQSHSTARRSSRQEYISRRQGKTSHISPR